MFVKYISLWKTEKLVKLELSLLIQHSLNINSPFVFGLSNLVLVNWIRLCIGTRTGNNLTALNQPMNKPFII